MTRRPRSGQTCAGLRFAKDPQPLPAWTSGKEVHPREWHQRFRPRHLHGKEIVRATSHRSRLRKPTSRRLGCNVVRAGSTQGMCSEGNQKGQRPSKTHFRSHELGSTTEGAGSLAEPHVLFAKSVISYLDVAIKGE